VRKTANQKACKDAGKDPLTENIIPRLPLYSLRHASASILLNSGVPVAVAAKIMGHSVDMFTETYADLLVEATREAAAKAGAFLDAHTTPAAPPTPTPVVPIRRGGPRQHATV